MKPRQVKLLQHFIVEKDEPHTVEKIAQQAECSEKTIRNDLHVIEDYLQSWKTAHLIRKPGTGIHLEMDEIERNQLYKQIFQTSQVQVSETERLIEIAHHLLISKQPITLQTFANTYFVHRGVITQDLQRLTAWLAGFELDLVSKPGKGSIIKGAELAKRNALAHISQLVSPQTDKKSILHLFLPHEISTVKQALRDMQQSQRTAFIDEAFESLMIHALIMIKRTRQNTNVFVDDIEIQHISEKPEFKETLNFLTTLETKLAIRFPMEEKIYFTWHVISAKRSQTYEEISKELENTLQELTQKLKELTFINFEEDATLMEGLELHMQAVLNRLTYGFPITNPLLSEIKKMYPYMFGMVLLASEEVTALEEQLPEDEIAYLVLHFQASIERKQQQNQRKKSGLIVCHLGVGMSHLLQAKLEQQLHEIDIAACIGEAELKAYLATYEIDFIISTVPLQQSVIPSILISPLLDQQEKNRVAKFIQNIGEKATSQQTGSPLASLLTLDSIFVSVDLEHRFEVVEMLANHLYEKGNVQKAYIHSVMQRERVSATSIGSGIALPHGNPKDVIQPVIAAAVLKEPVLWGEELVSIVFLTATTNNNQKQTKGIFQQLASLSEQPEKVTALQSSINPIDFLEKLKSH